MMSFNQRNSTKPTIAMISNTAWSIAKFRLNLIKELEQDYHVSAWVPDSDDIRYLLSEGINYTPLHNGILRRTFIGGILFGMSILLRMTKKRPDYVFTYTILPNIVGSIGAWVLGIKNVAIITGAGVGIQRTGFKGLLYRLSHKLVGLAANEVWFLNQDDRSEFVNSKFVNFQKTKLLPSEGINPYYFKSQKNPSSTTKPFSFLFAARLIKEKGVLDYVAAAKILQKRWGNQVAFNILGILDSHNPSSITKGQVNAWVNAGVINYLGSVDDVRPYLDQTNCFVLPSFYREGVPRSLLEAASMKVPIITTDNVGCRDVVEHNINGYLVPVQDISALVNAMECMIELSDKERQEMGKNGRKIVRNHFADEKVLQAYLAYLTDRHPIKKTRKSYNAV